MVSNIWFEAESNLLTLVHTSLEFKVYFLLSCREKDIDISFAQDAIDEYKVSVLRLLLLDN